MFYVEKEGSLEEKFSIHAKQTQYDRVLFD